MLDGVYLQMVEDMIKFSPELSPGEKLERIARLLMKRDAERRWPTPYKYENGDRYISEFNK